MARIEYFYQSWLIKKNPESIQFLLAWFKLDEKRSSLDWPALSAEESDCFFPQNGQININWFPEIQIWRQGITTTFSNSKARPIGFRLKSTIHEKQMATFS